MLLLNVNCNKNKTKIYTSAFFKEARATQARESRKSPANTATCNINEEKKLPLEPLVVLFS